MDVIVAEHALKHGMTETEIVYAWNNYIKMQQRPAPNEEYVAAIGYTSTGNLAQMVATIVNDGYLIFHAMTPPTETMLKELGMSR